MKQKLLLTLFIASLNLAVNAQKGTTYAITPSQKGHSNWTEVRQVDVATGQELKTVFKNSEETQPLNARTGKPVVKKELQNDNVQLLRMGLEGNVIMDVPSHNSVRTIRIKPDVNTPAPANKTQRTIRTKPEVNTLAPSATTERTIRVKPELSNVTPAAEAIQVITLRGDGNEKIIIERNQGSTRIRTEINNKVTNVQRLEELKDIEHRMHAVRREFVIRHTPSLDKPFSTSSAACAYDKKNERLYYTPMGIAQLRYIDLKSKTPQVFYFEDEQFGALRHRGDVPNQITRMVMGADGNGYALTNNAEHLIKFTTNKKAVFTDLGALSDDPANGKISVKGSGGYGGDIIAGKSGDLYLVTANRHVFQINVKNMVATYKGAIQGLPRGYSTNGAAVEEGMMVLVNSSNSTQGYYKFDMNTLMAEKVGGEGDVFNASDLANANLLADKKEEEKKEEVVPEEALLAAAKKAEGNKLPETKLGVYPNPVTNGVVNLLLDNYTPGRYQAKLIDVSGKQLGSKSFSISSKNHTEPFNLPGGIAKGNYLIQIYDQAIKRAGIVKLVVQ